MVLQEEWQDNEMNSSLELNTEIYRRRFDQDREFRKGMYTILCENFFQKYIPQDSSLLEIGAGYCEFINTIHARSKIALDVNQDVRLYAQNNIQVIIGKSTHMETIEDESVDRVFANNFFEHLTKPDIIRTLHEVHRILQPGGELLVLQPNIRYCANDYWMFFDHITPLDDRSMMEALEITGFIVKECIPQFLPYTTKSRLPKSLFGLKVYLRFPVVWKLFGKQVFIRAGKKRNDA
jgi:ubiquinone/menaquinone biosynthesis C-methylase UbiE